MSEQSFEPATIEWTVSTIITCIHNGRSSNQSHLDNDALVERIEPATI